MDNISQRIDKFIEVFIEQNGYTRVITGLENTLLIAVTGLIVGIIIGTLIATVRVVPKYKRLPRILNGICSFYVALFRGTPMVVQLLVGYYVILPLIGVRHPVCGQRTDGGGPCGGLKLRGKHDEDRDSPGREEHPAYAGQ